MRTARCTLVGGSLCGEVRHLPVYANSYAPDTGEIYFRTERRDAENRQIYMLKLGRRSAGFPKQNHFPEADRGNGKP